MAFTQNQLNALEAAIGSGELSVKYDGKEIQYRNIGDLIKAHNMVKSELVAAGQLAVSPLSNRGPATLAVFSRD